MKRIGEICELDALAGAMTAAAPAGLVSSAASPDGDKLPVEAGPQGEAGEDAAG